MEAFCKSGTTTQLRQKSENKSFAKAIIQVIDESWHSNHGCSLD